MLKRCFLVFGLIGFGVILQLGMPHLLSSPYVVPTDIENGPVVEDPCGCQKAFQDAMEALQKTTNDLLDDIAEDYNEGAEDAYEALQAALLAANGNQAAMDQAQSDYENTLAQLYNTYLGQSAGVLAAQAQQQLQLLLALGLCELGCAVFPPGVAPVPEPDPNA